MRFLRSVGLVVATLVVLLTVPAGATTLVRMGIENLAADNATIVRGHVVDLYSYWNKDHSFILTDVRVRPTQILKGERTGQDVTFTVMGGKVGDISTLIVGNPELVPGSHYMLFLNREDLPGAEQRLTVRDLVQGAFEIVGGRAVSQAARFPLLPDAAGRTAPPGGEDGMALDEMVRQIRGIVGE